MNIFKYLVLTLLLSLVLAGCGQGTTNNSEEDPDLGTDYETEQEDPATEPSEDELAEETTEEPQEEPKEEEKEEAIEAEVLATINLYFSDDQLMEMYRVEAKGNYPKNEAGIKSALELWAAGPTEQGLYGLVPEGVTVQSVKDVDGVAHVSFSNQLLTANLGSSGEVFLIDQIVMVVEQFGYNEVLILIDGNEKETLLGHMDLSEPFSAKSPEDYPLYQQ